MNYKRRISASISALALFLTLVIPISNQAFVESRSPRQRLSHLHDARVNQSNLVNRSELINSVDKSEALNSKRTIVTWRGGQSDHRWSNSANWVGGHVPGASDVARFPVQSKSDVDVDSEARYIRSAGHVSTDRSEEHTSELQSRVDLVCRLLLEIKNSDVTDEMEVEFEGEIWNCHISILQQLIDQSRVLVRGGHNS